MSALSRQAIPTPHRQPVRRNSSGCASKHISRVPLRGIQFRPGNNLPRPFQFIEGFDAALRRNSWLLAFKVGTLQKENLRGAISETGPGRVAVAAHNRAIALRAEIQTDELAPEHARK